MRQERLAALGQLIATVGHELRNPLSTILSSAYAARKKLDNGNTEIDPTLARIERNVIRCSRIIEELFDFGGFRKTDLAPVQVEDWLDTVLDALSVPDGITVERKFEAGGVVCDIDSESLRRVIINLFNNACEAMSTMEGAASCQQRVLTVCVKPAVDNLKIEFRDTGVGIAEDVLPRLFEPLFSTKTFGVGLGLPVVVKILEQHGGRADIANNEDAGVTATLTLPLSAHQPANATIAGATGSPGG